VNIRGWLPQSFFVRTLWLVLGVVLFSKALTLIYLFFNEDVLLDRQYSHGAALTLRAFWATQGEQREAVAASTGLRLREDSEVPPGESHWPYVEIFQRQMQMELGEDTETRLRIRQPPMLWVRAPSLGEDWVEVPLYPHPLRGQRIWGVLGWFLLIGLCSTAAAWIFVRQLSAPFKRLIKAVRKLGQGQSVRLPVGDTPSEMTELYRAFNQMAEDVEQATRERELMLAGVSHDLRTPLTRLRLALELQAVDDDLSADMIRDIEDMDGILDQFLAFIRDGRAEPLEPCDLSELVRETAAPFNHPNLRVSLHLQDIAPLSLRRLSMKRLLSNLLENALQHAVSPVEVTTSLATYDKTRYAVLCVLDRGPGIAEGELPHICNPFTRGNQARSGRGTGLGLAIVKRIAQQHGGRFELKNREGGGLEARVYLPISSILAKGAN